MKASKGKIKLPIKCNYIRELKAFDGKCWKCGSPIAQPFIGKYQCPSCGFLTFHTEGKYYDEWEYLDLDEMRVICSSAHRFVSFLEDNLGNNYDRIERSCSGLPEFIKINIAFSTLIDSLNQSSRIDYQALRQAYYQYARFLFEHGVYFYEALYNANMCELIHLKEEGAEKVKAVCHMPCSCKCEFQGTIMVEEALRKPIILKRDAMDTWYFDYDEPDKAIQDGFVIGLCHGEWETSGSLADAAMARMRRREDAWAEAIQKAKEEFALKGIENPDDTTPGYRERINELYRDPLEGEGSEWAGKWFKENWR